VPGCIASPPSSSRPTTAFAPRFLFPIRHAILTPSPSQGLWSTRIRAVPSAAFSSTASNVYNARPSCTPTRSRPELAQREHRHALHAAALYVVALHSSSGSFASARVLLLHSHGYAACIGAVLAPTPVPASRALTPSRKRTPALAQRPGTDPLSASARARRLCRSPVTQHRTCTCCCFTAQVLPTHTPAPAPAPSARSNAARALRTCSPALAGPEPARKPASARSRCRPLAPGQPVPEPAPPPALCSAESRHAPARSRAPLCAPHTGPPGPRLRPDLAPRSAAPARSPHCAPPAPRRQPLGPLRALTRARLRVPPACAATCCCCLLTGWRRGKTEERQGKEHCLVEKEERIRQGRDKAEREEK
jgi:hypothetical protein